jgi:ABC-2 type transport system ATP-binding protein
MKENGSEADRTGPPRYRLPEGSIGTRRHQRTTHGRRPMNSVAVESLTKVYGRVRAVDGISFDIGPGKVTGFLGPNGAGKSTTLRMILGLVAPTGGTASVLGRRYAQLDDPMSSVGAVLDTAQFHPQRSGRNHLRVLATAASIPKQRVDEVLSLVDLDHAADKKAGAFSLGMRQRLGIAAALLGDPQVLILDEPANGLDPAGIRWLRGLLRSFAAQGRTVFVSSHLLAEVSEIADDVIVINEGRLVTHAPVHELLFRTAGEVRVETGQPERLRDALQASGIAVRLASHNELGVTASKEVVGTIAAQAGIPIYGLNQEERSLEDIFFELTGVGGEQ